MANQTSNEDLPIAPVPVMRGNEEMLPSTEFRQAAPDWEGEEVHLRVSGVGIHFHPHFYIDRHQDLQGRCHH